MRDYAYWRKAEPVLALQWTGNNWDEVVLFVKEHLDYLQGRCVLYGNSELLIYTNDSSEYLMDKGDWMVLDASIRPRILPESKFEVRYYKDVTP
jgi:hypothetical protein